MRIIFLCLISFSIMGCISLRVPQLPAVDRVINPSQNPRGGERWLMLYQGERVSMIPRSINDATLLFGRVGEHMVISDSGFVQSLVRLGKSYDFITYTDFTDTPSGLQRSIFINAQKVGDETCSLTNHESEKILNCYDQQANKQRLYKQVFDEHNDLVSIEMSHPITAKKLIVKRINPKPNFN